MHAYIYIDLVNLVDNEFATIHGVVNSVFCLLWP